MTFQRSHSRIVYLSLIATGRSVIAYNGGVAIRFPNTTCPDGTFYTGTSLAANCCTDGTYGAPGGSSYCCPSESDCKATVENLIQCANSSWTYFPSPDNAAIGFCCLPDWVGYVQSNSSGSHLGVACGEPGYNLTANQTAVPSIRLAAQTTVTLGPSTTSSTSSTSATLATTTTAVSSAPPMSSTPPAASTGLSTGAQAGIGVGVGIGVIGLAVAIGTWILIRRKRAARVAPQTEVGPMAESTPPTTSTLKHTIPPRPVESGGQTYNEMPATTLSELGSDNKTHELPTDWHGPK